MEKAIIKFGNIEIKKQTCLIKNIDITKIVVSNKISFGKKSFNCFIAYKNVEIRPLHLFLPKIEETLLKLNICLL